MTRHLLTTLEGDDVPMMLRERTGNLPWISSTTPPTISPAPSKSRPLFWIAALGVGLYLLSRKAAR